MQRIAPRELSTSTVAALSADERRALLKQRLPVWVHNIITDAVFPQRASLLLPLRRFEGELHDSKNDEVVSLVLQYGFRNQTLDPFALPNSIPLAQRCLLLLHIGVWRQAYLKLEHDLLDLLADDALAVARWCDYARHPDNATVEID